LGDVIERIDQASRGSRRRTTLAQSMTLWPLRCPAANWRDAWLIQINLLRQGRCDDELLAFPSTPPSPQERQRGPVAQESRRGPPLLLP